MEKQKAVKVLTTLPETKAASMVPYANSYYGSGGGTTGSWGLNGRSISSEEKKCKKCTNLAP
jgi:hypothetical protein